MLALDRLGGWSFGVRIPSGPAAENASASQPRTLAKVTLALSPSIRACAGNPVCKTPMRSQCLCVSVKSDGVERVPQKREWNVFTKNVQKQNERGHFLAVLKQ